MNQVISMVGNVDRKAVAKILQQFENDTDMAMLHILNNPIVEDPPKPASPTKKDQSDSDQDEPDEDEDDEEETYFDEEEKTDDGIDLKFLYLTIES